MSGPASESPSAARPEGAGSFAGERSDARSQGLTVLIPAFNEEGAVVAIVDAVRRRLEPLAMAWEVIVIDDGSTDRTSEFAERAGARVLTHERNRGYGAALKSGIRQARYEWIAIVDADGTYPIEDLPKLLRLLDRYDMVVGARTGPSVHIPLLRRPAKWVLTKFANYLSGQEIPDLNSGMRVFTRAMAERFLPTFPNGFSFTTTITILALASDYAVRFEPMNYNRRIGRSSMRARDFVTMMVLVVRLVTYVKPLNVFLPVAAVMFTVGFLKAIVDVVNTNAFGVGSSMVMLMAVQLAFMGLLADLILRRTRL